MVSDASAIISCKFLRCFTLFCLYCLRVQHWEFYLVSFSCLIVNNGLLKLRSIYSNSHRCAGELMVKEGRWPRERKVGWELLSHKAHWDRERVFSRGAERLQRICSSFKNSSNFRQPASQLLKENCCASIKGSFLSFPGLPADRISPYIGYSTGYKQNFVPLLLNCPSPV